MKEDDNVRIQTRDNSVYEGDILVGLTETAAPFVNVYTRLGRRKGRCPHSYTSKSAGEERTNGGESVEWGPSAVQAMMDKMRVFPILLGDGKRTLGDMFDQTTPGAGFKGHAGRGDFRDVVV
ncbi:hypothetical protein BGW39_001499 [Mortierella sp. 14UC]|nr:hypothetical protein BGW39_001499 [Mortierella sp. 14UC]